MTSIGTSQPASNGPAHWLEVLQEVLRSQLREYASATSTPGDSAFDGLSVASQEVHVGIQGAVDAFMAAVQTALSWEGDDLPSLDWWARVSVDRRVVEVIGSVRDDDWERARSDEIRASWGALLGLVDDRVRGIRYGRFMDDLEVWLLS